LKNQRGNQNQ